MPKRGNVTKSGVKPGPKSRGKTNPNKVQKKQQQQRKPTNRKPRRQRQQRIAPKSKPKVMSRGGVKLKPRSRKLIGMAKPLRKLAGQIDHGLKTHCIGEQIVPFNDTPSSASGNLLVNRIIRVIDEWAFRAMMLRPTMFCSSGASNNNPTIGFQQLRGVWLYAWQYFMWKCRCVNGAGASNTGYGDIQIPLGLAKIFQQCAPYTDPITGTTLRNQITPLSFRINTTYFSIDANETADPSVTSNLGSPLDTYLIHASARNATNVEMAEFGTLGDRSIAPFTSTYVDWDTYFSSTNFSQLLTLIGSLFKGNIKVDDIPTVAPDASCYAFLTPTAVVCPVKHFNPEIAVMIGYGYDAAGANEGPSQFPYAQPLPVCRTVNTSGLEQGPATPGYSQTLRQVYAYVTSRSSKWVAGEAIGLCQSTGCFTDLKSFGYTTNAVDMAKFARKVFNALTSDNWNGTYSVPSDLQNTLFAMTAQGFTAFLSRVFSSASCARTGSPSTNTAFYVHSSTADAARMPAALLAVINSLGPVKVDGLLQLNRFFVTGSYVGINTPNATYNRGWTSAVSATGVWTTNINFYSFGTGVNPTNTITLTNPGTAIPFTRTDPSGIVYSSELCLKYSNLTEYYQNQLPGSFVADSLPSMSIEPCGNLPSNLAVVQSSIIGTTQSWANSIITATGTNVPTAVAGSYCMTQEDVLHAFSHNVLANPPNPSAFKYATRVTFPGISGDPTRTIQQALNSSPNSQYQATLRAQEIANVSRAGRSGLKVKPGKDIASEVSAKQTAQKVIELFSSVAEPGSGEREETVKSISTLIKDGIANHTKEKIIAVGTTFSGANLTGSGQEFTRKYVASIAPALSEKIVDGALEIGSNLLSSAFDSLLDYSGLLDL